ncbi:type VI secretion system-associated protein TagF [Aquabacterium sp. A7-Y]|uniref:type VI secretion system-associated protein TagF n=1 Tax=Aquabacterium sp. A7-Y TaxID=1349605 RepID=UPI00223E2D7F|nr:type VI secretion system-associated protein TagF [Aquabacterium sp. A7-Y]MCW7537694.1 type VI secretion system-associated protein TagF [Aquabacterium sp. A7-Y]
MNSPSVPVNLVYFGKVPSRGDFIRSANSTTLIQTLDHWLSQTMELLATDPRWKLIYDAAPPVQFAFLGSRTQVGLAGHMIPSQDSSGRRFPFITAGSFEVQEPLEFMARSPLALTRLWTRFENSTRLAHSAEDVAEVQQQLAHTRVDLEVVPRAYQANFVDFLEIQTLGGLEAMLEQAGQRISVRQTLLALGMLLQPVLAQGSVRLDKGLLLPLVNDPLYRPFVATLWLELVSRFLKRGDFELAVFVTRVDGRPALVIGFNGASPRTLRAVLDPQSCATDNVEFTQSQWVEDYIDEDYGVKKLSSYLREPQLSLRQALDTYREAFLGE